MERGIVSLVCQTGSAVEDNVIRQYVASFTQEINEIGSLDASTKRKLKAQAARNAKKAKKVQRPESPETEDHSMPKDSKKNCCIPGCRLENGPKWQRNRRGLFKLPLQDVRMMSLWLKAIPRKIGSWINENARVCSGHFDAASVNDRPVRKVQKDGTITETPRKRFELNPGAVPTVFGKPHFPIPTAPDHRGRQKHDKDIRRLQQKLRLTQALEEIRTFADLRRLVELRRDCFADDWIVKRHDIDQPTEALHFLQLDTTGLAIRAAISIPVKLKPSLMFQGQTLSQEAVQNILLQDRITSWPDVALLAQRLELGLFSVPQQAATLPAD